MISCQLGSFDRMTSVAVKIALSLLTNLRLPVSLRLGKGPVVKCVSSFAIRPRLSVAPRSEGKAVTFEYGATRLQSKLASMVQMVVLKHIR